MTKMESVEGKNKSTAYLQGCSVQGAIRFNSMTILLWFLTLKLGSTFIILSFTWRVPIPFNSKAKTHSRLRVKYYLDRAHWLGILDYYWLEWKLYSPLLFILFYIFFQGRNDKTEKSYLDERKGQYMFTISSPTLCEMARGLKDGWNQKASVFFSDNSSPTYSLWSLFLPSMSLPEAQID